MDPLEQLEGSVNASATSRVTVAEKWTACVALCVFLVCATAIVIGLVDILHRG